MIRNILAAFLIFCSSARGASFVSTGGGLKLDISSVASAANVTVLTNASTQIQRVTGSTTQQIKLPDATTLKKGYWYGVINDSSGTITVSNSSSTTLSTLTAGQSAFLYVTSSSTTGGPWSIFSGAGSGGAGTSTTSWSGYLVDGCNNSALSSTSEAGFAGDASGCSLTETTNNGFGTVTVHTTGGNPTFGIDFTAVTAKYYVCVGGMNIFNNTANGNFVLYLTDATTNYGTAMHQGNGAIFDNVGAICSTIAYTAGASQVYMQYKVQGAVATTDIGGTGVALSSLWIAIMKVP